MFFLAVLWSLVRLNTVFHKFIGSKFIFDSRSLGMTCKITLKEVSYLRMSLLFDFPPSLLCWRKTWGTPGGRLGGSNFGKRQSCWIPNWHCCQRTGGPHRRQAGSSNSFSSIRTLFSWSGTTFCQVFIVHQELNGGFRNIVRGREFPGSSVGKESTCSAGDPGLTPGLGRSPEEGKDYPFQYSGLEDSMERGACGLQSMKQQRVRHDWATEHACTCVYIYVYTHTYVYSTFIIPLFIL